MQDMCDGCADGGRAACGGGSAAQDGGGAAQPCAAGFPAGAVAGAAVRADDAGALFAHLEELVERLPSMQELDQRLAKAAAAAPVLACAHDLATREAMLADADRSVDEAERALKAAEGRGDAAAIDSCRRNVLYCGQQRGLCVGPVRNLRQSLERALADGGFSSVDDARSAMLDDAEREAGRAELRDYQRDYAATLAACQELA